MPDIKSQTDAHTNQDPAKVAPASQVKSPARRQLFALAAGICGATAATAIFNPARADDLAAKLNKLFYLDPNVLNFAFEIEEMQADFFSRIPLARGYSQLEGNERSLLALFGQQDKSHYDLLERTRDQFGQKDAGAFETPGTSSPRRPRFFRYPNLNTRQQILEAALDIKETSLFTYHGAVGLLRNNELLAIAAAIAGVEGRHTAVLRAVLNLDPVPAPFEGAITAQSAGNAFAKYGLNGGAPR